MTKVRVVMVKTEPLVLRITRHTGEEFEITVSNMIVPVTLGEERRDDGQPDIKAGE